MFMLNRLRPNSVRIRLRIQDLDCAEERAEGGGRLPGDFAERTGEVALVGEASLEADIGEGRVRGEHAFASRADAEAMDVFAEAFTDTPAKDAGEVHRMDAGFAGEFIEREPAAMLGLQLIEDAGKPRRREAAFRMRGARDVGEDFCQEAFDREIVGYRRRLNFAEKLQAEPEQRAATNFVARSVEGGGAIGKTLLPSRAKLDFVQADAARADFVLMGDARGAKHECERAVLGLPAAVALPVKPVEEQSEKREFMRMHGELAGNGVAQISKDSAALFALAVDGAEEIARAHVLAGGWRGD